MAWRVTSVVYNCVGNPGKGRLTALTPCFRSIFQAYPKAHNPLLQNTLAANATPIQPTGFQDKAPQPT